jgi:hypothetical protein
MYLLLVKLSLALSLILIMVLHFTPEELKSFIEMWELIVSVGSDPHAIAKALNITGFSDNVINFALQMQGTNLLIALRDEGFKHNNGVCVSYNYVKLLKCSLLHLHRYRKTAVENAMIYVVVLSAIMKRIETTSKTGLQGFKIDAKSILKKAKEFTL